MKVLIVSRFKKNMLGNIMPFVSEQGDALKEKGIDVDYYLVRDGYVKATKKLKEKIETFKPDLIHAHYGLCGITATLQNKVPVVVTFHNGETLNKTVNFLSSLFSLRAKHVVYVAQHIYDKCYFKRKTCYSIIPCGINLDDYQLKDKNSIRRELEFIPDKKYILFGGAFNNLRKNFPLLKSGLDLLERVDIEVLEMKGLSRRQIADLMCACDLFALPSKSEGSPQALKEAMACNCPIVATDVADIKHILGDLPGHFICTFEAKNVADKVAESLDFGKRTNGRDRIIELGLTNDKIADKLIRIYKSVL